MRKSCFETGRALLRDPLYYQRQECQAEDLSVQLQSARNITSISWTYELRVITDIPTGRSRAATGKKQPISTTGYDGMEDVHVRKGNMLGGSKSTIWHRNLSTLETHSSPQTERGHGYEKGALSSMLSDVSFCIIPADRWSLSGSSLPFDWSSFLPPSPFGWADDEEEEEERRSKVLSPEHILRYLVGGHLSIMSPLRTIVLYAKRCCDQSRLGLFITVRIAARLDSK